jgi:hypothetical protein
MCRPEKFAAVFRYDDELPVHHLGLIGWSAVRLQQRNADDVTGARARRPKKLASVEAPLARFRDALSPTETAPRP